MQRIQNVGARRRPGGGIDPVLPAGPDLSGLYTKAQVDQLMVMVANQIPSLAGLTTQQQMTQALAGILADTVPMAERTGGAAGQAAKAPRADHQHPRVSSSTTDHVIGADGTVTVTFTRTFSAKPSISIFREAEAFGRAVEFAGSYRRANPAGATEADKGAYVGALIMARRQQLLPLLNPLSGITLLTQLLTGLNAVSSALTGFDVFGGSAEGTKFTLLAVQASTPT